jgi:hypothetical protein
MDDGFCFLAFAFSAVAVVFAAVAAAFSADPGHLTFLRWARRIAAVLKVF